MGSHDLERESLQDYPNRSVWTTWAISYEAVRETHVAAANLLLLWAFLDRKDLWYGLFAQSCSNSKTVASSLSSWIGGIANDELQFTKAMRLLCNYSLVEGVNDSGSYATHPVVHRWAYHFQEVSSRQKSSHLAVIVVGCAVPSSRDNYILRRRLLPYVQACSHWVETNEIGLRSKTGESGGDQEEDRQTTSICNAFHLLATLYADQGKLDEAEKIYR